MKPVVTFAIIAVVACGLVWAQAPAQAPAEAPAQAPAGQASPRAPGAVSAGFEGSAYGKARELPARILDFSAQPASIKPGQSFTLIWHTENPAGVTIDPEPGRVMPRGSRQLKPSATTTYTLTARGPNNQVLTKTVTVTVAGTAPAAARADAGAEKFRIVRGPDDTGATSNCMPLIPPQSWGVPYQFQILQGANYVAIFHEYPGTFRIIPTDGGPHPVDPDPSWLGDSVGHWEGDTLVVDTIGFNDKTELQGYRHTEDLHMTERFRRTDVDTIQYEVTIEDSNVFARPWVLSRTFTLRPDLKRIDEFICENNRDYRPLFGTK